MHTMDRVVHAFSITAAVVGVASGNMWALSALLWCALSWFKSERLHAERSR